MICSNCGTQIPDDSLFCENCGTPLEPAEPDEVAEERADVTAEENAEEVEYAGEETAEPDSFDVEEDAKATEYTDETDEIEDFEEEEELEEEVEEFEEPDEEAEEFDEFKEIEELESMEEVDYEEDRYEDDQSHPEAELPEEAELPAIDELEFEETGQPEGAETEWLESFQQLAPKEEDWIAEPEEEPDEEEPIEQEPVEEEPEELEEEEAEVEESEEPEEFEEEEPIEEESIEEEPDELEEEDDELEEEAEEELEEFEEEDDELEEEAEEELEEFEEEEPVEEEPVEEEPEEEAVEEGEEPEEEPIDKEFEELEEEDDEVDEPVEEELVEEPEEEPIEEEPADEPEPEPEGAGKVGAWLGALGKQVHTGTGWAVDVAREKAAKLKEDRKASNKAENKTESKVESKPDRNAWSPEEEGELDLGYDFWYKSNQADAASRYDGMNDEEETKDFDRSDEADATTYVAVRKKDDKSEEAKEGEQDGTGTKEKKPVNKLKTTVIILVIAALLGAGGIFGSKAYTEKKQQDAYAASITKAEELMEAKDYASAEKIYTDLLVDYPDRAELYESLARVYMADEKYDDAKNTINEGMARTGKSKAYAALMEDLDALTSTEWREPYRRILADNEWAVRSYDDKNGSCVALCDITGDKRPEMLFFTQEYYGYGKLHIYSYNRTKGRAKELTYECKNRSTQYQDAFYDIENDDAGYVIYKSKTDGKFGIYESFLHRGVDAWQTTNRFNMTETDCDRESVIEACIKTDFRVSDDEDTTKGNEYYIDEKRVKYNAYLKEFKAVMDDIDEVVITSENTAGDKEIWNRIMDMEEAAMTYDGAMKILDEDAI